MSMNLILIYTITLFPHEERELEVARGRAPLPTRSDLVMGRERPFSKSY